MYMDSWADAGHGGKDPGAVDPREEHVGDLLHTEEKDPNLKTTLAYIEALQRSGLDVGASRTTDVFVSLEARASQANTAGATTFLSNHNNASADSTANGLDVYYYPGSAQGRLLAVTVMSELVKLPGVRLRSGNPKGASFYVLRATHMPAVLVEAGFLTNTLDEQRANDPLWLRAFGEAEARAVCNYLGKPFKEAEEMGMTQEELKAFQTLQMQFAEFVKAEGAANAALLQTALDKAREMINVAIGTQGGITKEQLAQIVEEVAGKAMSANEERTKAIIRQTEIVLNLRPAD